MDLAAEPFPVGKRASVSDAKQAYFEGDFERCLAICANIRVSSVATASEVALLTARAYLRTGRPRDAQNVIADSIETHTSIDASLTAQMLVATALIRQDDADTGIAILAEAAVRAADAHFAIRSEIAFCTALGYWAKRDLDAAEAHLARVDPNSDIIHARALELQAWCATARREYRRSADYFAQTLARLETCQASDRAIAATALSTLAIFAAELFDRDLARLVDEYARRMVWSSGLVIARYLTLTHQALFQEFAGNAVEAYELAMEARAIAPTIPFEVLGWGLSAAIARNAGEMCSATVFAKRAERLLETIDARALTGEERFALLSVAENCAHYAPQKAAALCATYFGLTAVDNMLALAGDPRLTADEAFIAGTVAQATGDRDRAALCYRKAFEMFAAIGYVRRSVTAAHALIDLGVDAAEADDLRRFITAHVIETNNYVTAALGTHAADALVALDRHPVVASLPPTQREVVALICAGKTNKEIAQLRNVGEQTIKNMLTKYVFRAFGVSSRSALVSMCLGESARG